ncbi:hypothetical protein PRUPE_1G217200 [Prunus persica]|uniref:Serine carboxypeptidase-like 45 n=1 Tax=Prunus persica TaxID=3760 RepID=A0A251R1A5_PRUPE|nr:hypothetical protein PRUPE_1G217200 [Prunus persica]
MISLSLPWKTIVVALVLLHITSSSMKARASLSELDRIALLPGQPQVGFQQYSGYVTVDEKKQRALFYYFAEAEIDPASKPLVLWLNGEANMLYLETPIGVGFSYSTDTSSYEAVNDHITGHYVPQLAELMLQYKEYQFNLKGIALGNPVLEYTTDFNSRAEFFWSHGLISDSTYKMFTSVCNYSRYVSEYYRGSVSPICSRVMSQVSRETSKFVDKYDVTLDVCISSVFSQSKVLLPQQVTEAIDVCVEDEIVNYLNRPDVQKALHARLVGVRQWAVCSNILDYQLLDVEIPTTTIVGKLIKAGIPVLVYSGDQDSVIPLTGSRTLVHRLAEQLGLNTTVPYRVWFEGQQVGGWTQAYGNILSFATIRGASHEAPFSQPERSLVLFKSFLEGRPLPEVF